MKKKTACVLVLTLLTTSSAFAMKVFPIKAIFALGWVASELCSSVNSAILPPRNEMLKRLKSVSDAHYFVEHFYPKLMDKAGEEIDAADAVIIVALAEYDFLKSLNGPDKIASMMYLNSKRNNYFRAILPPEEAEEAIEFYKKGMQASRKGQNEDL